MSNSVTFAVSVSECIEVNIGSTVMQVGHNDCLPLNVISSLGLTNLSFAVVYPTGRFTNWTISATNPVISTASAQTLDGQGVFNLGMAGPVLQGATGIGSICFGAVPGASAFVPLQVTNVTATKTDGTLVGGTSGQRSRVVAIGPEPLLEAWLATNAQRMFTLYGNPGASYLTEYNTNLTAANWTAGWRVPMSNLWQVFQADARPARLFYRALSFSADPPILELSSSSATNLTMLLYGRPGTNYVIETTTNLNAPPGWLPAFSFIPTNSYQFIETGSLTNRRMFFRAKRP